MKISILGNGAFGSAMGSYLSHVGHNVYIDEVKDSEAIFVCVPSHAVVSALLEFKDEIKKQKMIICSKGFAEGGKLISSAIKEKFKNDIFFMYGPTLAEELKGNLPAGMVLAGGKGKEELKKEIESENLYIELSEDTVGVEASGAFKNIFAILIGAVEGTGSGQNANALAFAKSIQEMKNIGIAMGGKPETFSGLCFTGDLYLSSRNRILGTELGKGKKIEELTREYTPAGIFALKDAKIFLRDNGIKSPVVELLYRIVFENAPVKDLIQGVMKV